LFHSRKRGVNEGRHGGKGKRQTFQMEAGIQNLPIGED